MSSGAAGMPGASASNALSSVVLPTPLRPTSTIRSPRFTVPANREITGVSPCAFARPRHSSTVFPDGRRIANLMYGR
jgi:hypothetical protein